MNPHKKQTNSVITPILLEARVQRTINAGFGKQKWVEFCEVLLNEGFTLTLYEARQTYSKYITVVKPGSRKKSFKVRFSNHKPNRHRELAGDCDFFVGVTHLGVTTSQQALKAVFAHFHE